MKFLTYCYKNREAITVISLFLACAQIWFNTSMLGIPYLSGINWAISFTGCGIAFFVNWCIVPIPPQEQPNYKPDVTHAVKVLRQYIEDTKKETESYRGRISKADWEEKVDETIRQSEQLINAFKILYQHGTIKSPSNSKRG